LFSNKYEQLGLDRTLVVMEAILESALKIFYARKEREAEAAKNNEKVDDGIEYHELSDSLIETGAFSIGIFALKEERIAVKITDNYLDLCSEWQILNQLQHENIIKVLSEPTLERGLACLQLELISGRDLKKLLLNAIESPDRGGLTEEAKHYVSQCTLEALIYLHYKKIVHRDLKAENLLVGATHAADVRRGTVIKLCDFGLSSTSRTPIEVIQGSPDNVSPETMKRKRHQGTSTDMFAYGTLLFVIFTSRGPFSDDIMDNEKDYSAQLKNLGKRIKQHVGHTRIKELILKCTQRNPRSRPTALEVKNGCYFRTGKLKSEPSEEKGE